MTGSEAAAYYSRLQRERRERRAFIADVLHDCLSSFQNIEDDHLTFDRDGAVEYLLSPASGLTITLED